LAQVIKTQLLVALAGCMMPMPTEEFGRQDSINSEKSKCIRQFSRQLSRQLSQELTNDLSDLSLSPRIEAGAAPASDSGSEQWKSLVGAVLSLYSTKTDTDLVIDSLYSEDCKFIDPLVVVQGQEDVKAQFRSLRMMFDSMCVDLHTAGVTGNGLVIESTTTFVPKVLPSACKMRLRLLTHLTLNESGCVSIHEDHWSLHGLLSLMPIIGTLYDLFRSTFGAASSALVNKLCPAKPIDSGYIKPIDSGRVKKDHRSRGESLVVIRIIGNLCNFSWDILRVVPNFLVNMLSCPKRKLT